jgi:hypothetical protein
MIKSLRSLSIVTGVGCLIIGVAAALSGGGTVEQVIALGHTLVIAGAILIAGVLVSSAILGSSRKE